MTNSVDKTALEVTVTENKAASSMTREQFEKIASDSSAWEVVRHEATNDFNLDEGVTYFEMSISNSRLGIDVFGIQFASDEAGDVEDGFTSEHKFSEAKVFDAKVRKRVGFPLDFGDESGECDEDWFFDLIEDIADDKINEAIALGGYSASDQSDDDDFDFDDMDTYGFGNPGRWSIACYDLNRSDENDDGEIEDDESGTVTVTGEFSLTDFENSDIDLDFNGCFDFSVTIKAEFSEGEIVRWDVEKVTIQIDDESRDGTIRDDLRSKFAGWIRSSDELDDLCDYIVKNEMKLD